MNSALELHDSTLSALSQSDGAVIVALRPAYLHMSDGHPGTDAGTGWWLDLDLRFPAASVEGVAAAFPVEIVDGSLEVGEHKHRNVIPLPLPRATTVELVLLLQTGGRLVIRGPEVVPEPRREPQYVEQFAGARRD